MNEIDFVFPYVDMKDKVWEKAYIEERRRLGLNTKIDPIRYREWDNLKFLFRGIEKFMPWIRNIYMIVSNIEQVPDWVDQNNVKIVLHKDIIPGELLPVFNSCAIEMFLKNIPGLSDKFIYGNDDCFPIYPLKEEDFFNNKGIVMNIGRDKGQNTQFKVVEYRTEKLAASCFGIEISNPERSFIKIQHSINPMRKEVLEEVSEKLGDDLYNSVTSFREEKNYNQYVYSYYEYFSEHITNIEKNYNYYSVVPRNLYKIYSTITEQKNKIVCLNDTITLTEDEFTRCKNKITEAFELILSEPSKYEKEGSDKVEVKDDFNFYKRNGKLIFEIPFKDDNKENLIINLIRFALRKRSMNISEDNFVSEISREVVDIENNIRVSDLKLEHYTKEEIEYLLRNKICHCPPKKSTRKEVEDMFC